MELYVGIALLVLSVIAFIYFFLISPRLSNQADMELLTGNYAHRGLWNEKFPENSMSAFENAARHGYGIELDIRLSKDNKIVVFHDDNLKRMCGVDRKVSDLTLAELKELRLKGTNDTIPTFREVLVLINGRVPLLIEFKGEMPEEALCRGASSLLDSYKGAFCIESFSPFILRWFKKFRPSYARGQLVTKVTSKTRKGNRLLNFCLSKMLFNVFSRPDFIAINNSYRRSLSFLICTKIFKIPGFIWTIRTPEDYKNCANAKYPVIFEKILPKGQVK